MKFWDSSAVVPLLIEETGTPRYSAVYARDAGMIVWWATEAECAAALSRREGEAGEEGRLAVADALARLDELGRHWSELAPAAEIKVNARRLLRTHPLRAADAFQLAAALVACEGMPATMEFVCADPRLIAAARLEGFSIIAPEIA
jgi:predicted nucleic acid-binding protein